MNLLQMLLGLLTGSAGEKIGGAVSGVAQIAAVMAAVAPVVLFLRASGNEVFHAITYNELAFWGVIGGAFGFLVVRLVHRAPPP